MINDINQQTMTKSVFLSILLWIFIYPLRVRAIESINFIHIGVNEGLSQNTVFDITQDKQGNMWFATYDSGPSCIVAIPSISVKIPRRWISLSTNIRAWFSIPTPDPTACVRTARY